MKPIYLLVAILVGIAGAFATFYAPPTVQEQLRTLSWSTVVAASVVLGVVIGAIVVIVHRRRRRDG